MASLNVCDNYIHEQQREIVPADFRITTVDRMEPTHSVDLCHQHFRAELAGLADGGMLPGLTYSLQRLG